ncbi:MAG TPA: N-acetylmuramoyl-L-alanine amidase, partial [Candidatus Acidoferrum sp.]|nr:N-acetylmuramoyl-L-alanine amidase [Candidatus Acidoferrum sp.]
MSLFRSRQTIRDSLLRGVYEQNLTILGIKRAFRRRRRFPLRPGTLSVICLGAILFGNAIQLNPYPWSAPAPVQTSSAWLPREWRAEPVRSDASSDAAVTPESFGEKFPAASGGASDAAEYRSLAQAGDLRIRKVFGLGVKTIMIDPGHGGETATGAIGKGGTAEKSINLDIAMKLKAV